MTIATIEQYAEALRKARRRRWKNGRQGYAFIRETDKLLGPLEALDEKRREYIETHGQGDSRNKRLDPKEQPEAYEYLVELIQAGREEEIDAEVKAVLSPDDLDDMDGDVIEACMRFGLVLDEDEKGEGH